MDYTIIFGLLLVVVIVLSFWKGAINSKTIWPLLACSVVVAICYIIYLVTPNILYRIGFFDLQIVKNYSFIRDIAHLWPCLLTYVYFAASKKHRVKSIFHKILLTILSGYMAAFWIGICASIHISIYGK